MAKDFSKNLEELLKKNSDFVDQEGELLRSAITDSAYKADKKLIELLISKKEIKDKFFSKIKDITVFNINEFVSYIQDKNFLVDSYTKYRNKIGLNIDGKFLNERKEVALVWPFKDCVLEGGMTKEDEKRKEIFFNEILAEDEIDKLKTPKVLTNWKRYSEKGEEDVKELKRDENGTIKENLIIKGNNLLALYSLKEQFQKKVKLIYIDPPYNTGNDSFGYNDRFNHSTWLTFMKNRLEVAKELLRDDGVIFIQYDDNEQAYLKILMDEIFNRENFVSEIIWRKRSSQANLKKNIVRINEYILVYQKTNALQINLLPASKKLFSNPDNDPKGLWSSQPLANSEKSTNKRYVYKFKNGAILDKKWIVSYKEMDRLDKNNLLYWPKSREGKFGIPRRKFYFSDNKGNKPNNLWVDTEFYGNTEEAGDEIRKIFGDKEIFGTPKPTKLIKRIIQLSTTQNDTVLDFFAGSGTTGHAILELNKEDGGNRKFILVEQLDEHIDICKKRIEKVIEKEKIKDDFVSCELMEYNEGFVEKIRKAKNEKGILKVWQEIKEKGFLKYNVDIKEFDKTIDDFKKLSLEKQKHILFDILNKNQLYVNLSDVKDKDFKVSSEDRKINKEFYSN